MCTTTRFQGGHKEWRTGEGRIDGGAVFVPLFMRNLGDGNKFSSFFYSLAIKLHYIEP